MPNYCAHNDDYIALQENEKLHFAQLNKSIDKRFHTRVLHKTVSACTLNAAAYKITGFARSTELTLAENNIAVEQ